MPGKRITCQQYRVYMKLKKSGLSQAISSAKAGFAERTGRNLDKRRGVALGTRSQKTTKRKNDPLEAAWQDVLLPLLEQMPNLTPRTLLEYLQVCGDNYNYRKLTIIITEKLVSKFLYLWSENQLD